MTLTKQEYESVLEIVRDGIAVRQAPSEIAWRIDKALRHDAVTQSQTKTSALLSVQERLDKACELLRRIDSTIGAPNPTNPDDLRVATGKLFEWQEAQLAARAFLTEQSQ